MSNPRDGITGDACPLGTYCITGSHAPVNCENGTYSNVTGSFSCHPIESLFHRNKFSPKFIHVVFGSSRFLLTLVFSSHGPRNKIRLKCKTKGNYFSSRFELIQS